MNKFVFKDSFTFIYEVPNGINIITAREFSRNIKPNWK